MRRVQGVLRVAVSVALAALAVAALGLLPHTIPALYVAAVAPELTRIDLREHRLPNRLVVPGLVVGLVAAGLSWAVTGRMPLVALIAAVAFGGFLLLLGVTGGIGMGDVKLAAMLGLASPTLAVAVAAPLAAFLLGGAAASVVLIRRGRRAHLAFGPALLAGYALALVVELSLYR